MPSDDLYPRRRGKLVSMEPAPAELSRRRLLRLASLAVVAPPILAACGSDGTDETVLQAGADSGFTLSPDDDGVDAETTPAGSTADDSSTVGADGESQDPTSGESEVAGVAGSEVTFTYLDGTAGSIADFNGKPTVLNFFASWCPPCRHEMPDFEEAHQTYKDRLNFVGIATNDEADAVVNLVDETGVTYPIGLDPEQSAYFSYGGITMPTTVFLKANGEVAQTWFGILVPSDLEVLIEDLL